jgi:hypothetical protein
MTERRCVTNNPLLSDRYEEIYLIDGTSRDVFIAARDLVHRGWKFLGHPLYGNFRPSRQPYRTLALEHLPPGIADMDSFVFLESIFQDEADPIRPGDVPEATRKDFAVLDAELMKDTLERYFKKNKSTA